MPTEVRIIGRIRRLLEALDDAGDGSEHALTLTQQLELLTALGAAPYQEIVRPGRAFWTGTTAAIAAVVAIPTTAHMLALFNTEPDNGRSLIIDWVAAQNVVSTAAAGQAQVIANIGQVREVMPTAAAVTFKKLNGMGGGQPDTSAIAILNATALPATTGLAANWFPLGPSTSKPGAAATPGHGVFHHVEGRVIVPPGRYFALHVLANVIGETFVVFCGYHEKQLLLD